MVSYVQYKSINQQGGSQGRGWQHQGQDRGVDSYERVHWNKYNVLEENIILRMEKYVPTMNNVKIQGGVREQGVEGGRCFMFTLPWLDINRSTWSEN